MESFSDIDLIVFDFDETIAKLQVDWNALKSELSNHFRERYGFDSLFSPLSPALSRLKEQHGERAKQEAYTIIENREIIGAENQEPIVKTIELIKHLKQDGKQLAIFSSNTRKVIEIGLNNIGLHDYFGMIIAREDVEKQKPDPEGLLKILDKCKIPKERVIYIGDRETDREAGNSAGINTIMVEEL
ncbi:MAG: HAD-IA family hydrolase [Candidatus Aenigmarchaeota archaeon]|nr:HAD-IA family hydrolase [Candidatus Aenigmarchaeota archaeon]